MENNNDERESKAQEKFSNEIKNKTARKIQAKEEDAMNFWSGFRTMGMIGWSVVIPTLLGVALGTWLDQSIKGSYSWTIMLLVIGLVVGCLNAWYWVKKEDERMKKKKRNNSNKETGNKKEDDKNE